MIIILLLVVFGVFALVKGELPITRNRHVRGNVGRGLGVFMLAAAAIALLVNGVVALPAFVIAVALGLATSEPNPVTA